MMQKALDKNRPYQFALIDMHMPIMNGEELGHIIKSNPIMSKTILVMLTPISKRDDGATLKTMGFTSYLAKPIRREQLHSCLILALEGQNINTTEKESALITRHSVSEDKRRQIRLLIVDDNVTNQAFARITFKKLGFTCKTVDNGAKAIKAIQDFKWDLVIMDCQMPVMDGYEATRQIRKGMAGPKNKDILVIAMTAQAMKADREKCLNAGMNDYLTKPVKPLELRQIVEKWLFKGNHQKDFPKEHAGKVHVLQS